MTNQSPLAQASDEPMRALPESWRNSDISWICSHLKENTIFDVERLQREWNEMKALAIEATATPRATADVERDAARYHWLREQSWVDCEATFRLDLPEHAFGKHYNDALAEAIDAAIAATKGAKL